MREADAVAISGFCAPNLSPADVRRAPVNRPLLSQKYSRPMNGIGGEAGGSIGRRLYSSISRSRTGSVRRISTHTKRLSGAKSWRCAMRFRLPSPGANTTGPTPCYRKCTPSSIGDRDAFVGNLIPEGTCVDGEASREWVAANGRPLGRGGVSRDERNSPSTRVGCSRTGPAALRQHKCLPGLGSGPSDSAGSSVS